MGSLGVDPERAVAKIYNSTVAGWAIGAAWELGVLDELRTNRTLSDEKFAVQNNLDVKATKGLVTSLVVAGILRRQKDSIVPGDLFEEVYRTKSLFHWLAIGSGSLFARMPHVLRNENRKGEHFYTRDSAAIAYACRDINSQHFDPAFWSAMNGLDYKFTSVVDIGCGSGERLMQILDKNPGVNAIGIDLAGPALKVAAAEATERGYGGRLAFAEGDARKLMRRPEFDRVDLLTCFMMGHDFWPRDNCVLTLRRIRESFPNVKRFVLGDTPRILLDAKDASTGVTEDDVPIFSLGFEFGHAMMGVYIPTVDEWESVFSEGGWRIVQKYVIKSHSQSVIFVLEHA